MLEDREEADLGTQDQACKRSEVQTGALSSKGGKALFYLLNQVRETALGPREVAGPDAV